MTTYPYTASQDIGTAIGLITLQSDETIEGDFRRMIPPEVPLYISRVPSADEVSGAKLQRMANHITTSASLFPKAARFGAVGYGCTSGTAQIGAGEIARLVQAGVKTPKASDPLTALIAACRTMEITRLAFLSPYVAQVSQKLRDCLAQAGIATPVFGSFDEAEEAAVVRIDAPSIIGAALDLAAHGSSDAIFLSCTNLRTLDVIAQIEAQSGLPCLSSNQVLAWHLARLTGYQAMIPGQLGG